MRVIFRPDMRAEILGIEVVLSESPDVNPRC